MRIASLLILAVEYGILALVFAFRTDEPTGWDLQLWRYPLDLLYVVVIVLTVITIANALKRHRLDWIALIAQAAVLYIPFLFSATDWFG